MDTLSSRIAADRLRTAGVPVTLQRLEIARVLLTQPVHLSADQVLSMVRERSPEVSRATVYNTLRLFREKNLVKELIVDPERVVYDSNTDPHYHLYDVDTGELSDVSADELQVVGMPKLPGNLVLDQVDVIIRVRKPSS
ncbi:transcriptional repressor [Azoarcus communis]|uniref:Ferric uptake regulation protein n=1 Tax=Parazoarcus communis SWub3 = DSM 12120 TaxID=1121029 RepID=A0A323V0W3_9RHOO|nr:Fur family transcriptional regulator [Parazoarcus communis]NMG47302.1 transcriptional repressor [Parazoarcus communis]NMG70186.1 transcriptional repressor [Parazoarcus communis SWub3 = DSM 12120]PZA18354.1 transcriptional repressor [Azoarcus communis] [Parazoarcus communis SWub3 = DSM 12120]